MKTSVYSSHYDKLRLWLKARREEQSLSLREVSERWGRHHSILGKIEQARRKIELVEFIELCEIIGADPHDGLSLLITSMNEESSVHKL
ncbi:helix-turn-helix transcriptional regulator [Salinimonas marina]|uniref:Helix-turn-helix transcriptional regulator n=1 Tax=Salinimonas marina TaxID=2785918 RepID=A0A7S9HET6_9ALTE|nr:helix-turn-helix transcriptional regulator [Salinimonas marina]QPG07006.1 helix-turn-helix transcriptional regulator [Salinimonas marina]